MGAHGVGEPAEPAALDVPPLPTGAPPQTQPGATQRVAEVSSGRPQRPQDARSRPGRQSLVLVMISMACLVATLGVVLFAVSRLSSDEGATSVVSPSARNDEVTDVVDFSNDAGTAQEVEPTEDGTLAVPSTIAVTGTTMPVTAVTPDVTTPSTRPANLYAGVARLRLAPALDAAVLFEISNRSGAPLTVLSPVTDGWYEVEFEGTVGWLFGSFVLPADEGFFVAETIDSEPAVLLTEDGDSLGIANPSGNKVLIVGRAHDARYRVVLPDGSSGWVEESAVRLVG